MDCDGYWLPPSEQLSELYLSTGVTAKDVCPLALPPASMVGTDGAPCVLHQTFRGPVHHLLLQGELGTPVPTGAGFHIRPQATCAHPLR